MIAFVRHGQTAMNRAGRLQGRIDAAARPTLGRAPGERARRRARDVEPVARVVASPLAARGRRPRRRSRAAHGLAGRVDDRLVELDYGEWDERGLRDVAARRVGARGAPTRRSRRPGGESLVDVTARVVASAPSSSADDARRRGEPRLADQGGGLLGAGRRRARDLADVPRPRVDRRASARRDGGAPSSRRSTRRPQRRRAVALSRRVTGIERRAGQRRARRRASTTNRPSPGPSATGMPSASSSAWSSSAARPVVVR